MPIEIVRPLRATRHCRHYSYENGLKRGPRCALGIDLSAGRASVRCWPAEGEEQTLCASRADYTDEERATWKTYLDASIERLGKAVQALPAPIPLRTSGDVACPNCDSGRLHYARWHRGAEIRCTTPNCCGPVHFSIDAGADWPAGGGDAD